MPENFLWPADGVQSFSFGIGVQSNGPSNGPSKADVLDSNGSSKADVLDSNDSSKAEALGLQLSKAEVLDSMTNSTNTGGESRCY